MNAPYLLPIAMVGIAISGCSSISARTQNKFYPGVCPGAQNSVYYISHPEENDMPIVAIPFGILDFPLTTALDTALLPFDLPFWAATKDGPTPSALQ